MRRADALTKTTAPTHTMLYLDEASRRAGRTETSTRRMETHEIRRASRERRAEPLALRREGRVRNVLEIRRDVYETRATREDETLRRAHSNP